MKRYLLVLVVLLLAGGCDSVEEEANAGLLGLVLDAETGNPLSGVEVRLDGAAPSGAVASRMEEAVATTGADGRYRLEFRLVEQATVMVRASKTGYSSQTAQTVLTPGTYLEVEDVRLAPEGSPLLEGTAMMAEA